VVVVSTLLPFYVFVTVFKALTRPKRKRTS